MKKLTIKYFFWISCVALFLALGTFAPTSFFSWTNPIARAVGTTYSVCALGCDYTTIYDAMQVVVPGDTVVVSSSYNASAEVYSSGVVSFTTSSLTVDCQNSGAVLGYSTSTILILQTNYASSTIQNCSFDHMSIVQSGGNESHGFWVFGNTFSTSSTSTVFVNHGNSTSTISSDFVISNNTNINNISINNQSSLGTIANNTIYNQRVGYGGGDAAISVFNGADITIASNTVSSNWVRPPGAYLISVFGTNIDIASNTISFPTDPVNLLGVMSFNSGQSQGGSYVVRGNYVSMPANISDTKGFYIAVTSSPVNFNFTHNTVRIPTSCTFCTGMLVLDNSVNRGVLNATTTYSIFFRDGSSTSTLYGISQQGATGTVFNFYNDYNGFYNLTTNIRNQYPGVTITAGANTKTSDPFFKTGNADTQDDLQLTPFSPYLDVNGAEDIGAYQAARRANIYIDDDGVIDYDSVDATTTAGISNFMRDGDAIILAAGSYGPVVVSSSAFLSGSVSVSGQGASTIISSANTSTDAIFLNGVNSSTIQNILVRNATSSRSIYNMTNAIYSYNGNSYGDAIGGDETNQALVVNSNSSCSADAFSSDYFNVTSYAGATPEDWHLALIRLDGFGGLRGVFWVPNQYYSTAAQLEAGPCNAFGLVVERWVTSTFAIADGDYTYNAAAVGASSITLNNGFVNPPRIDRINLGGAGIRFYNASNNTVSRVTSTDNLFGVWFANTSTGNAVVSSTLNQNSNYDVKSTAVGANSLKNVSFTRASSTLSGAGNIYTYFTARAYVINSSSLPLGGVVLAVTSSNGLVTTTLSTDNAGYTPYTDYLLAFIMTSSSIADSNGGYNPYIFSAAASSTLSAALSSALLISPDQTVTITMVEPPAPAARSPIGSSPPLLSAPAAPTPTASPTLEIATSTPSLVASSSPIVSTSSVPLLENISQNFSSDVTSETFVPVLLSKIFTHTLGVGSVGDEVKNLQKLFAKLNIFAHSVTGYFGPITLRSLQVFQQENKLPLTNSTDIQTRAALNQAWAKYIASPLGDDSAAPIRRDVFKSYLYIGSRGEEVRMLQQKLKDLGYYTYPFVTGNFGPVTKAAVVAFQKAHSISPFPGWVGPSTRAALNEE